MEIRLIRRMRGRKSALIELDGDQRTADILFERIREAGHTEVTLGQKRSRIYLARMDHTVSEEELQLEVSRNLNTDNVHVRLVFVRDNGNGTKAACIEL